MIENIFIWSIFNEPRFAELSNLLEPKLFKPLKIDFLEYEGWGTCNEIELAVWRKRANIHETAFFNMYSLYGDDSTRRPHDENRKFTTSVGFAYFNISRNRPKDFRLYWRVDIFRANFLFYNVVGVVQ